MPMQPRSIYILLFYLRTDTEHRYHWVLLLTGSTPPSGKVYHATDRDRRALDLYREAYPTRSGMLQSATIVVALYLCPASEEQLDWASRDDVTHLMHPSYLPRGEQRWTCRVWAKTVLEKAHGQRLISLPAGLQSIELSALATADRHKETAGRPAVYNDLSWFNNRTRAVISSGRGRTYATDPMEIDSTGGRRVGGGGGGRVGGGGGGRVGGGGGGSKPMQGVEYYTEERRPRRDDRGQGHGRGRY